MVDINKLQNRERLLSENVIREAGSETSRWGEACELEVEARQPTSITNNNKFLTIQITVLKLEVEKMRSALSISEGKLKLLDELAKGAMTAEKRAERSLRLSERRIAELLNRTEHQYRQLEKAECTDRKHGKVRYVWCWPLWRFPAAAASVVTGIDSSSCISNGALLLYGA